jgi:hypothetical protein
VRTNKRQRDSKKNHTPIKKRRESRVTRNERGGWQRAHNFQHAAPGQGRVASQKAAVTAPPVSNARTTFNPLLRARGGSLARKLRHSTAGPRPQGSNFPSRHSRNPPGVGGGCRIRTRDCKHRLVARCKESLFRLEIA